MAESPAGLFALDIDGVLTDGTVTVDAAGNESKRLFYRDIDAVFRARRLGLEVGLVTAESTPLAEYLGRRLEVGNLVLGARQKLSAVQILAARLDLHLDRVCFVGDSARDAEALAAVGFGLAPADASTEARTAAARVLRNRGGHGAVDEALGLFEAYLNLQSRTSE